MMGAYKIHFEDQSYTIEQAANADQAKRQAKEHREDTPATNRGARVVRVVAIEEAAGGAY